MKVTWYCPNSNFRDFKNYLDEANFRLRVWYNHLELLKDGHQSVIAHNADAIDIGSTDLLVLTSMGELELNLAKTFKYNNKKVVHEYSENIRGIPILEETKRLCDGIICCSTWLQQEEAKTYGSKVYYTPGPTEPVMVRHNYLFDNPNIRVAWMGNGGNAQMVRNLLVPIILSLGYDYVEISNLKDSTHKWNKDTWASILAGCDITLCPQAHWSQPAKGNNKVITSMSLGIPVLASPVQAYREIIKNGNTGYICETLEDWRDYLIHLKDKDLRRQISDNCDSIVIDHSVRNVYLKWLNIFNKILSD